MDGQDSVHPDVFKNDVRDGHHYDEIRDENLEVPDGLDERRVLHGQFRGIDDAQEKRATLSAVYAIIAGVTVPFFIFVMPRIVASLHPDPIINTEGKVHMNGSMLTVFLSSVAGFTSLYFWMLSLKVRAGRLESHQSERGN